MSLDGKVELTEKATGTKTRHWPIDARELLQSGEYIASDPVAAKIAAGEVAFPLRRKGLTDAEVVRAAAAPEDFPQAGGPVSLPPEILRPGGTVERAEEVLRPGGTITRRGETVEPTAASLAALEPTPQNIERIESRTAGNLQGMTGVKPGVVKPKSAITSGTEVVREIVPPPETAAATKTLSKASVGKTSKPRSRSGA